MYDDLKKVKFSDMKDKFLALEIIDTRKQDSKFDHFIFVLNDREIFADYIIEYAETMEDEIFFEPNEEFSIVVNSSPQWFSFEDLERIK